MDVGKAERVAREVDAYAHWFVTPSPSADGHFLSLTLFAESGDTAHRARDIAALFLRDAGLDRLVDDVRLVVSELVGNVVNHAVPDRHLARPGACRRIDVTFKLWPKWFFVGVTDEDSTPPLLPVGEMFSPALMGALSESVLPDSGRGFLIIQRLTDAVWWSQEEQGGKTVWCRFDLNGEADDRSYQ